nr:MAG TPA: hypothetical protein [Caudoviricetes sp.]
MANQKSSGGRTPRTPRKPAEGACAPVVTFPIEGPKPRQTAPEECTVRYLDVSADAVRIRVLPMEAAVRRILNEAFGPPGWSDRYYYAGGQLRCQVGVYSPATGEYVHKDAGPLAIPSPNPAQMQETTSFLRAAAMVGAGEDVMDLKPITLKAAQVQLVQGADGKYRPVGRLVVDRFARDERGAITMVQFALPDGKKILWPDKV